MSNGTPWWQRLDGARQVLAQDAWLCQVCGEPLPTTALVVLDGDQVVSDTALHPRCLAVADAVCPHLAHSATRYIYAEVTRLDLLADGRPPDPPRPTPPKTTTSSGSQPGPFPPTHAEMSRTVT